MKLLLLTSHPLRQSLSRLHFRLYPGLFRTIAISFLYQANQHIFAVRAKIILILVPVIGGHGPHYLPAIVLMVVGWRSIIVVSMTSIISVIFGCLLLRWVKESV